MPNETEIQTESKTTWRCCICQRPPLGELGAFSWFEIKSGGEGHLLREGLCAECGVSNFEERP